MISWFLPEIMEFIERERRGAAVEGKRMGSGLAFWPLMSLWNTQVTVSSVSFLCTNNLETRMTCLIKNMHQNSGRYQRFL